MQSTGGDGDVWHLIVPVSCCGSERLLRRQKNNVCVFSPEDDAVSYSSEQTVGGVGVHREDVFTVRVLLQRCIDPVNKRITLLLYKTQPHWVNNTTTLG